MKIKFILFFLLLQLSSKLSAQSEPSATGESRKIEIGIDGGVHKTGFYDGRKSMYTFGKYKPFWTYTASAYFKTPTVKTFYAGLELEQVHVKSNLYYTKPYGYRTGYEYDALFNLDYINLHLLFGSKLFSIKKITVSGTLSPYFGYLLGSQAQGSETVSSSSEAYSDSLGIHTLYFREKQLISGPETKKLRKVNIGWCFNLDVAVPLQGQFAIICRASYNLGIYSVINEDSFIGIRGYEFLTGIGYKLNKQ
ncbi:MAG TPA: outer membrane beta-barrel protein [Bacteroidia bacterium]|jgi:hypothetical protein|nr:outer membrane beta-barrel protein [Bacteroidia bacterium]